jgi:hypothetical protein
MVEAAMAGVKALDKLEIFGDGGDDDGKGVRGSGGVGWEGGGRGGGGEVGWGWSGGEVGWGWGGGGGRRAAGGGDDDRWHKNLTTPCEENLFIRGS